MCAAAMAAVSCSRVFVVGAVAGVLVRVYVGRLGRSGRFGMEMGCGRAMGSG